MSFYNEIQLIKAEKGFQTIIAVDVNGDGLDEVVKVNFDGIENDATRLKITVYSLADGKISTPRAYNITVPGVVKDGEFTSPISRSYYFGNFRGDGKAQLLIISHNRSFQGIDRSSFFSFIDLESGKLQNIRELFTCSTNDSQYVHAIDLDGDGKTELCYATDSGYDVYTLNGNSFEKRATHSVINRETFINKYHFGDLNGDGKIDILKQPKQSDWKYKTELSDPAKDPYKKGDKYEKYIDRGNVWTLYSFTGLGFVIKEFRISNTHSGEQYVLIDINNDGYPDLVQFKNDNLNNSESWTKITQERTPSYKINVFFNKKGIIERSTVSSLAVDKGLEIIPSNIVDYKSTSSFISIENDKIHTYNFSKDEGKANLLTSMLNSYGLEEQNTYQRMGEEEGAYFFHDSTTKRRNHPYAHFNAPLILLSNSSLRSDNYHNSIGYMYYGPVIHRTGLGFCGFEKITTYESNSGKRTTTEMNPEMFGVTTKLITPTHETTYNYLRNLSNNKKCNPYVYEAYETDLLNKTEIIKDYSYDEYNNPIEESIYFEDNIQAITKQTYENITTTKLYAVGIPKTKETTHRRNGSQWKTKEVWTHNTNILLPISKLNYIGSSGEKKTGEIRWEYDANGKLISEKTAVYDQSNFLGSTYSYDNTGRYLVASTNAMGQTTHYADYDKYGNAQTITDHKGRVTTYEYDEYGQLKRTKHPDGSEESAQLAWGGEGLYTLEKKATNSPTSITHYDALGREIKTGIQRFDDSWQYVEKQYDRKGRLEKTSLPFKGAAAHWNSYEYDEYDRPIKLTEASGRVNTWEYGEKSVTETKNGIASKKIYNSAGQLIKVVDPGGEITYQLRADEQPESITAPSNIVTQFEYDDYGRQTAIVDPSAGRQTYSEKYENGLLVTTQTDANNKTITIRHDQYGRVTKIDRPEFSTTYEYDEEGRVTKESSTNGTVKSFAYDNVGRIISEKEEIPDSKWFSKSYSYDENQLASVNYASNLGSIVSEHFTYRNGYNTEIKLNDEISIWKLRAENALGQPTKALTGVLERSYGYTDYGMPVSRIVGNIQKMSYAFAPLKGNILSRTDEKRAITETFEYDELNRLSRLDEQNLVYDSNGNIKTMPLTGELSYTHESKPYAVTGLSPISELGTLPNQQLSFTSFQRPESITEEGIKASFLYNAAGDRVRMKLEKEGTTQLSRYYLSGQYESDIEGDKTKQRLYLGGTAYSAPAVYVNEGNNWNIYYICRDYLGSITHIANADGTLKEEYSYDAWGRLRDTKTQALFTKEKTPSLFLARGYTGHEHLPEFGLVNMNARLYAPMLGRFLSPDPYVQDPFFSQNYNRYSYCLNNPLLYVDISGEDYWHTNNEDEIKRFFDHMRKQEAENYRKNGGGEGGGDGGIETFNYKGWTRVTDQEFMGRLTYNDATSTFHTSYGSVVNGEYTHVGISFPAYDFERGVPIINYKGASPDYKAAQAMVANYHFQRSGAATPTTFEAEFIFFGGLRGLKAIGSGVKALIGSWGKKKIAANANPKAMFNSAESLIQAAKKLARVKGARQGVVQGDGNTIFRAISQKGTVLGNGTVLMKDGTILSNHLSTKTGVYTIDINKAGMRYKIRVVP